MNKFPEEGYMYIVCGARKYLEEAAVSVRSLKRYDPKAHVTIVTDASPAKGDDLLDDFDHIVVDMNDAPSEITWNQGLLFKVRHLYASSPYERSFFVDSDTYFIANCRCLFKLLDYYDLSLTHGTNDRSIVSVSDSVIEGLTPYNTGVILFRKSDVVQELFEYWHSCYVRQLDHLPQDQPAFMEALSLSKCKTYVLQNNWNARFIYPEKYAGKVMLLHGRHSDLDYIAKRVNVTTAPRAWLPLVYTCVYPNMKLPDVFEAILLLSKNIAKFLSLRKNG